TPFRERARREGFRSVLAIPLLTRHAAPAALILYKADPYRYSYTDLELASIFGNHAAVALENAALYGLSDERLQEQTRRMEAIVESMRDGLILASPSGRVLYCNQRAAVLLGVDALQVMGRDSAEITTPFFDLADIKDKKQIEVSRENPVQDLRIHFFNVNDARGNLIGRGQLWQDVTHDKELDRMKSALLSTVSHELRTPLATIKGYASTLLAPDVTWDAAAQAEFVQTISDEADRLTALVKDLLDMSRIEAGILDLHCELFDLNDLLKTLLPLFSAETRTRIKLNLANKLPLVSLDQVRINTVMRNLVENALKYSPDSAAIEVRTYQADGQVVFAVRDFGVGVSEAQSKLIFQRFYRADNRLARQTSGIGLGLSICKGFVEAHGGRIWVDSAEKGATFSFALAYHL
ncbi:MAG TPA: PAS domain-containing protein, partial [Anaerolineae bacterium]|nr:PAS domain-containing protein [Anaerolineae bacterium]